MLLALILAIAMQPAAPSQVQVISRESMSGVDEAKQAVARSAAEWAALWRQHAGTKALPPVDFGSRTVVAVFLGTRSSAGFSAEITGTRQSGGKLIVEWQERAPGRDQVSAQVLTSPAVIASIPKFTGEVVFEKVEK
jgi:hypothetical protein